MKRLLLPVVVIGLTQCAPATTLPPTSTAAPAPAPTTASSARIDFVKDTLANGLTVVYHVDRTTPIAAVNIWYDVGSKHEQQGRTGFAHLFEHVMFKGSRNVGDGQHFALLEQAGGRGGADINGTTWYDRTNYFEQVPSNQLELALWLEADRMATLLETLSQEKLDNQREVVKNERRQSYDNQPYGIWLEKMTGYAYPAGHPYHHAVIGSMEDLSAATLDDVRNFFRMYYSPDNAVLVVAGDIDLPEARRLVQKHFGDIPRGLSRPALRIPAVPPRLSAPVREVINDANARAPRVYVGFRTPPQRVDGSAAVPLLAAIVGSGRSSHLYSVLIRDRQAATAASAFNLDMLDAADLLVVTATGRPGSNPDSLESAVKEAIASAINAITPEQLARVKASVRYQFVNQLQNMGGFGGRADRLAEGETYYGDPAWVNRRLAELDAVTLQDVRSLATSHLVPTNTVTLVFVPAAQTGAPRTN